MGKLLADGSRRYVEAIAQGRLPGANQGGQGGEADGENTGSGVENRDSIQMVMHWFEARFFSKKDLQ